eukprot:tig00021098_g18192.t1
MIMRDIDLERNCKLKAADPGKRAGRLSAVRGRAPPKLQAYSCRSSSCMHVFGIRSSRPRPAAESKGALAAAALGLGLNLLTALFVFALAGAAGAAAAAESVLTAPSIPIGASRFCVGGPDLRQPGDAAGPGGVSSDRLPVFNMDPSSTEASGTNAYFNSPFSMAFDPTDGSLYVGGYFHIWKINGSCHAKTIFGSTGCSGLSGGPSDIDAWGPSLNDDITNYVGPNIATGAPAAGAAPVPAMGVCLPYITGLALGTLYSNRLYFVTGSANLYSDSPSGRFARIFYLDLVAGTVGTLWEQQGAYELRALATKNDKVYFVKSTSVDLLPAYPPTVTTTTLEYVFENGTSASSTHVDVFNAHNVFVVPNGLAVDPDKDVFYIAGWGAKAATKPFSSKPTVDHVPAVWKVDLSRSSSELDAVAGLSSAPNYRWTKLATGPLDLAFPLGIALFRSSSLRPMKRLYVAWARHVRTVSEGAAGETLQPADWTISSYDPLQGDRLMRIEVVDTVPAPAEFPTVDAFTRLGGPANPRATADSYDTTFTHSTVGLAAAEVNGFPYIFASWSGSDATWTSLYTTRPAVCDVSPNAETYDCAVLASVLAGKGVPPAPQSPASTICPAWNCSGAVAAVPLTATYKVQCPPNVTIARVGPVPGSGLCGARMPDLRYLITLSTGQSWNSPGGPIITQYPEVDALLLPDPRTASPSDEWAAAAGAGPFGKYTANFTVENNSGLGPTGSCSFDVYVTDESGPCLDNACPPREVDAPLPVGACSAPLPNLKENMTFGAADCMRARPFAATEYEQLPAADATSVAIEQPVDVTLRHRSYPSGDACRVRYSLFRASPPSLVAGPPSLARINATANASAAPVNVTFPWNLGGQSMCADVPQSCKLRVPGASEGLWAVSESDPLHVLSLSPVVPDLGPGVLRKYAVTLSCRFNTAAGAAVPRYSVATSWTVEVVATGEGPAALP